MYFKILNKVTVCKLSTLLDPENKIEMERILF